MPFTDFTNITQEFEQLNPGELDGLPVYLNGQEQAFSTGITLVNKACFEWCKAQNVSHEAGFIIVPIIGAILIYVQMYFPEAWLLALTKDMDHEGFAFIMGIRDNLHYIAMLLNIMFAAAWLIYT